MLNKLHWRFTLIIVLVLLSWAAVHYNELKRGTDLAGGVDLIYELDLSKTGGEPGEMAARVIATLKRRVDPTGVKNLTWRVVGNKRIEIQMPLANEETRKARAAFRDATDAVAAANLRPAAVQVALNKTGADREKALDQLAPQGNPRRPLLDALVKAFDEQQAVRALEANYKVESLPVELLSRATAADDAYAKALSALLDSNIDLPKVTEMLEASDDPKAQKARDELAALPKDHPGAAALLDQLYKAYAVLREHRTGGFDDPADLQRMLKGAGVLDFRIAVRPDDDGGAMAPLIEQAREQLQQNGPRKVNVPNVRWFEIDPKNGAELLKQGAGKVIETYAGDSKTYILLYTDLQRSLTHDTRVWKLTRARVQNDPTTGGIVVAFSFDDPGANYFGALTGANLQRPLAIVLDDKAISAPNIQSAITGGNGVITFGDTATRSAAQVLAEAEGLVRMLEAGSLPATLQPEPISVQTISASFGEDNIRAGLQSGLYAVIAVIFFMAAYYTLSGFFANVAVLVNLIMLLAVMALIGATFTLPGIAGIVLTLGMAVDANVLINERIREEVHKGASLWMAVRLGYDRVFWTIFDSNLTTALSAVVLIFVASEEVKGFGVTLLIGLTVSMFTALFVTRTLMIAAVRWGILRKVDDKSVAEYIMDLLTLTWLRKGVWPFMKVITISNFDWIGKRHIFWVVSGVISVAGLAAFVVRGNDKYDTEFNGGTQVTFQLKEGKTAKVDQIRARVGDMADALSKEPDQRHQDMGRELKGAQIIEIGNKATTFQIVTTIADTETLKVKTEFLDRLTKEFQDVLDVSPRLEYKGSDQIAIQIDDLLKEGRVRPVTKRFLDQIIPGSAPAELGDNDITEYQGGVAMVLDDINPPQTQAQLTQRIKNMRQQPDFSKIQYRDFKVIPLAYAPVAAEASGPTATTQGAATPTAPAARLVTRAVVVSADQTVSYSTETADQWRTDVAATEWDIVQKALTTASSLQGVSSFDPVVADAAKVQALVAIIISLGLIIIYVWVRFGGIRYGIGAILSLGHDAIVALAATVLSKYAAETWLGQKMLITDFKVNLTMIAAYLTIIGYSVNDTIVIFDRIRENRGQSRVPLTAKLVNDSINQCFGRTIWTTFTVFIVVLIMYVWGGEGVRGFSFAMLIGVFTGAYSTLAIASPTLLSLQERAKSGKQAAPALQPLDVSTKALPEAGVTPGKS